MRERRGEFPPVPQGDIAADGSDNPMASVPPEAIELLGAETCEAIADKTTRLERLDRLASTPDPFKNDYRPSDIDLGFLKDDQAEFVVGYHTDSNPSAFYKRFGPMKLGRITKKLLRAAPRRKRDLIKRTKSAAKDIALLEDQTSSASENADGPLPIEGSEALVDQSTWTAEQIPPRSSFQTLRNMYTVAGGSFEHGTRGAHAGKSTSGDFMQGLSQGVSTMGAVIRKRLDGMKSLFSDSDSLRRRGTECHRLIIGMVKNSQVFEASGLLDITAAAKQQLPRAGSLEEDELEQVAAVEQYLAGQVDIVEAVIREADPEAISKEGLSAMQWIRTPSVSIEREQREIQRKRAEVGEDVISGITQAKNVLRGGGRLRPPEGQTEKDVQQKAQDLHSLTDGDGERLLEREESGVIVAAVTGHFDRFRKVVDKIKLHTSNGNTDAFPADRAGVINEIRGFDLEGAMRKIHDVLGDPNRHTYIEKVLKLEEVEKLKAKIKEVLEPEEPQPST
ncbi:MAG TPA: hypothetical protein VFX79_03045 [Candidatus Saccharimonadales bacterium]|nr:hypothetical protein [Candidatus Saccharimonadales bacterium]